jgi:hypothetical protein
VDCGTTQPPSCHGWERSGGVDGFAPCAERSVAFAKSVPSRQSFLSFRLWIRESGSIAGGHQSADQLIAKSFPCSVDIMKS